MILVIVIVILGLFAYFNPYTEEVNGQIITWYNWKGERRYKIW